MAVKTDDNMLEYLSILAKLEIEGGEKESLRKDLEKMLDYVDMLNELDTSEVEPLVQAIKSENVFRDDAVTESDNRDEIIANAPQEICGQFAVPKTFN